MPETILFTLIHGTFAQNAPWTQDGSSLRATLTEAFEPASVIFRTPQWSGKNLHRMRKTAAVSLRQELLKARAEYPSAKHFVIAHSHGGNVVRQALEEETIENCVDGVVTLNTPFIESVIRDERAARLLLACIGLFCFPAVAVNVIWPVSSAFYSIATTCLLVVSFILGFLLLRYLRNYQRESEKKRRRSSLPEDEQRRSYAPENFLTEWRASVKRVPFLCLVSAGDEAISGLSFLEGLANIPHILFHPTLVLRATSWFVMLVGLAALLNWVIAWPTTQWICLVIMYVPWGLLALLAIAVIASALLRSVWLGLPINPRSFAEDLQLRRWTVSAVPLSVARVDFQDYQVGREGRDMDSWDGELLHSSIYEAEYVLTAIQLWIKHSFSWPQPEEIAGATVVHRPR